MAESAQATEDFLQSEREVVENGVASTETAHEGNEETTGEDSEWMDLLGSGQVLKKVLRKGIDNSRPQQRDVCTISFEGKLSDGTVVERLPDYQINLGDGEVIQGIDLVLALMNEGETAEAKIGPRFAYGSEGRKELLSYPAVPPDETVTYTIELKSVCPEPAMEDIPISERKRIGSRKRERGNYWYHRREHTLAINCYRRALEYLDEAVGGITVETTEPDAKEEDALRTLLEERLKVYNNLAVAQLKIGALDAGLSSVNNVLRCQPDNVKAIFRKAKILSEKGEISSAIDNLQRALTIDPSNNVVKAELHIQKLKAKEASQQEKKLYRMMMGGSDSQPRPLLDSDREQPSRSKLPWGMVVGSIAVVLAGMVAYRYKFI